MDSILIQELNKSFIFIWHSFQKVKYNNRDYLNKSTSKSKSVFNGLPFSFYADEDPVIHDFLETDRCMKMTDKVALYLI